jgi:ribose transport system substrate-binding protein
MLAASAVAIAGLVAACGSSTSTAHSGSSSSSPSSAGSSAAPTDAASSGLNHAKTEVAKYRATITSFPSPGSNLDASAVAALKGKTVLYVPITAGAAPFIQQQTSLQAAFGPLGIKVVTCDPKFVPTAAAACMDNAQTNGASAVITSGIPYAIASNAYRSLEQKGIPTLAASSGPGNPASTKNVFYMDNDKATELQGTLQADTIIAQVGGHAKILYVNAIDSPVLVDLAAATKAEFTKYCPGCTIIDAGISTTNLSQLPSLVSSKLISNPDITYIAIQADPFVPLVLAGVQSSNFISKVKAVGQTADTSVLKMIQEKQFVISDVGINNSYLGWVDADGILRMLTGQTPDAEPYLPIRIFDADNLTGSTVGPTTDVDTLFGSLSFKDTFFKTWGGK